VRQKFISTTLPEKSAKCSNRPSVADGNVKSRTEAAAGEARITANATIEHSFERKAIIAPRRAAQQRVTLLNA
jgi:hypothetical protein